MSAADTGTVPGPLLLCALGPELWALRGAPGARVVRAGMGPVRARRGTAAALAAGGAAAVVSVGFGAGLGTGMEAGEVVVADEVRGVDGAGEDVVLGAGPCDDLLAALRGRGLSVRRGVLHSADHVVRGAERARLASEGALALDMEAAAVLATAAEAEVPVRWAVKVIVDTPEHELLRPGTLPRGLRAWRTLRAVGQALAARRPGPPAAEPHKDVPSKVGTPARHAADSTPDMTTLPSEVS